MIAECKKCKETRQGSECEFWYRTVIDKKTSVDHVIVDSLASFM